MHFKYEGMNVPGLIPRYWDGETPALDIAGPGLERQPILPEYLYH